MNILIVLIVGFVYSKKCLQLKKANVPCNADAECSSEMCIDKVCYSPPNLYENCGVNSSCAPGLGCNIESNKCELLAEKGSKCQANHKCNYGLLCYKGICGTPSAASQACSDDGLCASGLTCGWHLKGKKCIPKKKRFQFCKTSDDCRAELYCSSKLKICRLRKGKNKKCHKENCEAGLTCLMNKNPLTFLYKRKKCKKIPKTGKTCNEICAPGYYCGDS
jgi:hypothetical protein